MNFKEFKARSRLAWRILRSSDGNLVSHAKRELACHYATGVEMNIAMADHLVDMVRVFSSEGHSGFSASYAQHTLNKLFDFQPLRPLTGEDDEWNFTHTEDDGAPCYQNNRCSHVFRRGSDAYDIDGVVFEEPDGTRFTGFHSRVPVTFPYLPRTVVAKVTADATDEEKQEAARLALIESDNALSHREQANG